MENSTVKKIDREAAEQYNHGVKHNPDVPCICHKCVSLAQLFANYAVVIVCACKSGYITNKPEFFGL